MSSLDDDLLMATDQEVKKELADSGLDTSGCDYVLQVLEPWGLKLDGPWSASANRLRKFGHTALPADEQLVWFTYQKLAKRPLPGGPTPVTEALVKEHLEAFDHAVNNPDTDAFEKAKASVSESLVVRMGTVGFFASKTPMRSVSLPDWVSGAVCVNTKSGTTDLLLTKHHDLLDLKLWAGGPAVDDAVYYGHRYRVRCHSRLTLRQIQFAVYGMHHYLDRQPKVTK